ncbi:hypothetical protein D3C84_702750 [compost metagenome]
MGNDDAINVVAVGQLRHAATQLQKVFVGDALGGDLHDLFAANVGHLAQFRYAGDQLIDADFRRLIRSAVGGAGASAGNGAAGSEDHHVRQFLLGFGFFCLKGGRQEQQKG